jgi:hypothetical protein
MLSADMKKQFKIHTEKIRQKEIKEKLANVSTASVFSIHKY